MPFFFYTRDIKAPPAKTMTMRMRKKYKIFILDKTIIIILLLSSPFCGSDKPTIALEHTKRWLVIDSGVARH